MHKSPTKWVEALAAVGGAFGLLMLPARWALAGRKPRALQEIETLDDAVAVCQRSGLSGWELVTSAQRLWSYHQFAFYSCRTCGIRQRSLPTRHGILHQNNLALKQILDRLGFASRLSLVQVRVRQPWPDWSMGHTWLRVTVDGETRNVCAGHADNLPGQVNFTPLAPVWPGSDLVLFLTHLGMVRFLYVAIWSRGACSHAPPPLPGWMFQDERN